jgi:hypothetical protein
MERILRIEEVSNFCPKGAESYSSHDGFQIITDKQTITLSIDNGQSCCESWGYFLTEDDTARFCGAELRDIAITDKNRSARQFGYRYEDTDDDKSFMLYDGDVMFVDIKTSEGILQFVAYNAHNGYYGHTAIVSSSQLSEKVHL